MSLKFVFYSDDFVDDTTVTKQMCGTGNIFVADSHHSVKILFSLFYSPCDHFLLLKTCKIQARRRNLHILNLRFCHICDIIDTENIGFRDNVFYNIVEGNSSSLKSEQVDKQICMQLFDDYKNQ